MAIGHLRAAPLHLAHAHDGRFQAQRHLVDGQLAGLVEVVAVEHELELVDGVHRAAQRERGQELERVDHVVAVGVEQLEAFGGQP